MYEKKINEFIILISEPALRGILIACAEGICACMGFSVVYLLNTIVAWRTVALICLFMPLITMIAVCFVCFPWKLLNSVKSKFKFFLSS